MFKTKSMQLKDTIIYRDVSNLQELLKQEDTANSYLKRGKYSNAQITPLHLAVEYNWREGVELLLNAGADVTLPAYPETSPDGKAVGMPGRTPVALAIENKMEETALLLLKHRENLEQKGKEAYLSLARKNKLDSIVQYLEQDITRSNLQRILQGSFK